MGSFATIVTSTCAVRTNGKLSLLFEHLDSMREAFYSNPLKLTVSVELLTTEEYFEIESNFVVW